MGPVRKVFKKLMMELGLVLPVILPVLMMIIHKTVSLSSLVRLLWIKRRISMSLKVLLRLGIVCIPPRERKNLKERLGDAQ